MSSYQATDETLPMVKDSLAPIKKHRSFFLLVGMMIMAISSYAAGRHLSTSADAALSSGAISQSCFTAMYQMVDDGCITFETLYNCYYPAVYGFGKIYNCKEFSDSSDCRYAQVMSYCGLWEA